MFDPTSLPADLPPPVDDGGAAHLPGIMLPSIALPATSGDRIDLAAQPGRVIVFAYPRTGRPGEASLVDDWDLIPGARGCTPQACSFRDLATDLKTAGANAIFGLSTQDPAYQKEAADRLHLPFPLLSDEGLALTRAARFPAMEVGGETLIRRLALVLDDGRVTTVFYPVFPPDRNAADVLAWLQANPPAG